MNFESLNLHPTVMDGVRAMRYMMPTPLQSQAIPPALEGRDVIGLGRTGAGITAYGEVPVGSVFLGVRQGADIASI